MDWIGQREVGLGVDLSNRERERQELVQRGDVWDSGRRGRTQQGPRGPNYNDR